MLSLLLAAALTVGSSAPSFLAKDVRGRDIEVPVTRRPVLLCFVGRSTADGLGKISGELVPRHPRLAVLNIIDLTSIPGLLQGVARSRVNAKHADAVKAASDAWRAAGKTPPDNLDSEIHLVPDFDGKIPALYGVHGAAKKCHLVLVDSAGRIAGDWEGTPDPADVEKALTAAIAP